MTENRISASVGEGGVNKKQDVLTVQKLINTVAKHLKSRIKLAEDGVIGPKTIGAIKAIQLEIVKMMRPDGVVDPNGKTIRVLRAKHKSSSQLLISYGENARKVLSPYTINILKLIMNFAEVNSICISSTHRQIEDQVRIMYNDNCKATASGKSVGIIRGYGYGKAGTAVDKVYADNVGKLSEDEIKKKMGEEIETWLAKGVRTSLHCVTKSEYDKLNVLDIPFRGIKLSQCDEFEAALIACSNQFNKRRFSSSDTLENVAAKNLIQKTLVERVGCWHLEIPQDGKPLPRTFISK